MLDCGDLLLRQRQWEHRREKWLVTGRQVESKKVDKTWNKKGVFQDSSLSSSYTKRKKFKQKFRNPAAKIWHVVVMVPRVMELLTSGHFCLHLKESREREQRRSTGRHEWVYAEIWRYHLIQRIPGMRQQRRNANPRARPQSTNSCHHTCQTNDPHQRATQTTSQASHRW